MTLTALIVFICIFGVLFTPVFVYLWKHKHTMYKCGKYRWATNSHIYESRWWWFTDKLYSNAYYLENEAKIQINKLCGIDEGIDMDKIKAMRGKPFKLQANKIPPVNEEPPTEDELNEAWGSIQDTMNINEINHKRTYPSYVYSPHASVALRREVANELKKRLKADNPDLHVEICRYSPEDEFSEKYRCYMKTIVVAFDERTFKEEVRSQEDW